MLKLKNLLSKHKHATITFVKEVVHTDGCTDAKRYGGVVGYIKKCFGEIDRLRVEPAMTERFPSLGEREDISCAKRTVKNLLPLTFHFSPTRKRVPLTHFSNAHKFALKNFPLSQGERGVCSVSSNRAREQASFAKQTDMNFSLLTSHFSRESKRYAFTLAEVLITLGIIGVVAALTMPSVIQNHRKHVIETKLKKFYTVINQAIGMSVAEYGNIPFDTEAVTKPEAGYGESTDSTVIFDWYNKYILKHLNGATAEKIQGEENGIKVTLPDGTGFTAMFYFNNNPRNPVDLYLFYCLNVKKCEFNVYDGKNGFLFDYDKNKEIFSPSYANSPADLETLKHHSTFGCYNENTVKRQYCTQLIRVNGWKLPDDYPWVK